MRNNKLNLLVHFDQINVNAIENAAGIFIGTNTQLSWESNSKSNLALGRISGKFNRLHHNVNVVYDNDFLDTYINDRDVIVDNRKTYGS
jgi:hypothetical protein